MMRIVFLNKIQKRLWIHSTPDPYKIFIRVLHEIYAESEAEYVKVTSLYKPTESIPI
jgi:hypothetical protein